MPPVVSRMVGAALACLVAGCAYDDPTDSTFAPQPAPSDKLNIAGHVLFRSVAFWPQPARLPLR